MASLLDTITEAVKGLDTGNAGKAITQALDTGKSVSALSTAASGAAESISAVAQEARQTMTNIKDDVASVANTAKVYAGTTLALQAIAAAGIFWIQYKAYNDRHAVRRTANNPRRRRSRR
jgi:methyl-accepting chemotaxis protein